MNGKRVIYNNVEFVTGDKITCMIRGLLVKDAEIYVYKDSNLRPESCVCFLCQNIMNGVSSPDTLGYDMSWRVYITKDELSDQVEGLKNVTIKDELVSSISGVMG